MRGFQPAARERRFQNGGLVREEDRGGNMGKDAVLAAIRAQSGATPAPQTQPSQQPSWRTAIGQMANALSPAIAGRKQQIDKESGYADGGRVRPQGFVASDKHPDGIDTVPARLTKGEYVLPTDTVQAVGVENLDALRAATHNPARGQSGHDGREFFFAGGSPGGVEFDDVDKAKAAALVAGAAAYGAGKYLAPVATGLGYNSAGAMAGDIAKTAVKDAAKSAASTNLPGTPKSALGKLGSVGALADTAYTGFNTSTEDYRKRFGLETDDPSLLGDVGVRTLGAASDLGNAMTFGLASKFFRDKQDEAATSSVASPSQPAKSAARTATAGQPPDAATQPSAAGDATMPAFDLSARSFGQPVTAPTAPQNDIKRTVGPDGTVSYSGQNIGPDATINGQTPGGGFVSVPAFRPAGFAPDQSQAGAVQAPTVSHSGNSWAARNDLRNREVSASSIMNNGGRWDQHGRGVVSPERMAYLAALKNDMDLRGAQPGMDKAAMEQTGANQRTAMQEAGATTRTGMTEQGANAREAGRNALTAEELGLKKEAAGFQTRAAQQQEQLRNVLLDPKSTPEQRAVAQRNLSALSGKTAADRMQTVALPDTTNEMGQVVRGGQALVRVLEDGTVQQVPIGAQAPAPIAAPKAGEVRNGYRFKGGDPNDQANWTKV